MRPASPPPLSVAALILAAGEGSRMGRLKQLLPYGGGTLLWHAIDTALDAAMGPVYVVVGAEAQAVREATSHKPVTLVDNPEWRSGIGSSIAAGVRAILLDSGDPVDAACILLADQPKITARRLSEMRILLTRSEAHAVAAEYSGSLGVPAFFRRELLERLVTLPPESGAKGLLLDPALRVLRFPLPEAAVDVDTPADFASLNDENDENPAHLL